MGGLGRREPGNIRGKSCRRLALAVPIRLQNETQQKMSTRGELISADYTLKVDEKQFLDVRKGHKSGESKVEVGLQDRLSHHTSQLQVYMHKVRHETQQSCGSLENEKRNSK